MSSKCHVNCENLIPLSQQKCMKSNSSFRWAVLLTLRAIAVLRILSMHTRVSNLEQHGVRMSLVLTRQVPMSDCEGNKYVPEGDGIAGGGTRGMKTGKTVSFLHR